MNLPIFLLIAGVIALACIIVIVLEASTRWQLSIRETLHELWQTYFGGGNDLPHDPGRNRKLE